MNVYRLFTCLPSVYHGVNTRKPLWNKGLRGFVYLFYHSGEKRRSESFLRVPLLNGPAHARRFFQVKKKVKKVNKLNLYTLNLLFYKEKSRVYHFRG